MENIRNSNGQFKKGVKHTLHKAIIGTKYNEYEVISNELFFTKNDSHPKFKVRCNCGEIKEVRADWLKSGKRKKCIKCSSKITYKNAIKLGKKVGFVTCHQGVGNLTKVAYGYIKRNASRRNLEWDLDINFLWDLFLKQEKKCKLTGQYIHLTEKRKNSNIDWNLMTASLDRIDSNKGYIKDNVQWVHKDINRFKNNYSQEKFIEMCKLVTDYNVK